MRSLVLGVESQTSTTYADFFDSSFTFFNESIQVRCCAPDLTLTNVTCGQGTSCIGRCSAIGASLCLSEVCTADPDDCNISLEPEKRKRGKARTCKACQSSQKLRKCAPSESHSVIARCMGKTCGSAVCGGGDSCHSSRTAWRNPFWETTVKQSEK